VTLFQGTLKTVASRHKCGDTLPKKIDFCLLLGKLFKKKGNSWQNISFSENCVTFWWFFAQKKLTDNRQPVNHICDFIWISLLFILHPDDNKKPMQFIRRIFGRKMAQSCEVPRNKGLKSPDLDNKLKQVAKI
jgi:hypothetical protein